MDNATRIQLVAAVAAAAGLWYAWRKLGDLTEPGAVQDTAARAVGAVADVADAAVSGVVLGIGDVVGVPRTQLTDCERSIAEGRWWDASFDCPASRFLGAGSRAVWNSF